MSFSIVCIDGKKMNFFHLFAKQLTATSHTLMSKKSFNLVNYLMRAFNVCLMIRQVASGYYTRLTDLIPQVKSSDFWCFGTFPSIIQI